MTTDPFQLPGAPPSQRRSTSAPQPPSKGRRYRRTWVLVTVALLIGIAFGYVVGGRDSEPAAAGSSTAAQPATPDSCLSALSLAVAGNTDNPEFQAAADDCRSKAGGDTPQLGEPARDGAFTFVVNDVSCGETVIGSNEFSRTEAQGVFCLVKVTVSNHGNSAQELIGSAQKLIDNHGRVHDHSDEAWLALEDGLLSEQINPGNQVEGTLVFDVPRDTKVAVLELHDSLQSGGVRIAVP